MSRHHRHPATKRATRLALRRAGRRCQQCGLAGRLEYHHPLPLSEGGDHDQALEVVCRVCHLARHHQPDPARVAWARFLVEEFSPC